MCQAKPKRQLPSNTHFVISCMFDWFGMNSDFGKVLMMFQQSIDLVSLFLF